MYCDHSFIWKTNSLRKIVRYVCTFKTFCTIFYNLFPLFLAPLRYRVKRPKLIWQRSNHRPIFAFFQRIRNGVPANIWTTGSQKALCLVSTPGPEDFLIWTATIYPWLLLELMVEHCHARGQFCICWKLLLVFFATICRWICSTVDDRHLR